jgi:bacteriocin-like protein
MSSRVLSRTNAREISKEELEQIEGGHGCLITACGQVPHFIADDTRCF